MTCTVNIADTCIPLLLDTGSKVSILKMATYEHFRPYVPLQLPSVRNKALFDFPFHVTHMAAISVCVPTDNLFTPICLRNGKTMKLFVYRFLLCIYSASCMTILVYLINVNLFHICTHNYNHNYIVKCRQYRFRCKFA